MESSGLITSGFMAGGGEMGELIRSKDWSESPMGSPDRWPQSLRTTLSILLNSKFPMFLWWGPELICFYNDAYRPSLGRSGKHPSILGMPADKAWPEIWHIIEPLINKVLTEGESTWSEDQLIPIYRNNEIEDVYWTFSYSPVNDESGEIAGVFVTCSETTDKVLNLQKLKESESKFRNTVKQAPVAICILKGPAFVVEMANEAYLQIVDKSENNFVGKPLFESLPETASEVGHLLKEVLESGRPFFGTEFPVSINRFGKKERVYFNFVYQPRREEDGSVSGIIVMANEVTTLVEAKHSLTETEKKLRQLLIQSPVPMAIFRGNDYIIEMANTEMIKNIWRKEEKEVIGEKILTVFPELANQKFPALLEKVYSTGNTYRENESLNQIQINDGMKSYYLDVEYAPLFELDGSVSGILVTANDVTEKVQARQEIELAEARLRLAIEAASLATWDLDLHTMKVFYSQRLVEIFGHSLSTVLTFQEVVSQVHPDDREIVNKAYERALITGMYDQEARIIKPGNNMAWIRIQGKIIIDEAKHPLRMLGTLMDITDAKTAEENTATLAAIIKSSEDAIVSKTLEGIITSWNPGAEKLFGYTAEEMLNQSILKIIPPDRYNEEPVIIKRILMGERIEHFDTRRLHKNGKLIDISLSISPVRDRKGNIIGASKIARDITERVEAAKKIEESSERLRMAIESTHLGTWDYKPLTGELNWSEECKKIYGIADGVKIDFEVFSDHIFPDDKEFVEQAIQRAMDPGGDGTYDITYRITRFDDNSIRWIRSQGKVGFNEQQQAERFIGTVIDITEQRRTHEAIEESEQRTRLAIDAAEMGTFDWNLVTQEFISSPRLNHIFGYQGLSNITHQHLIDAFLPLDRPVRDKAVTESAMRGSLNYEARILWPDKSIHWVKVYGKIVYGEKQKPLRMHGTVLDITEEKATLTALEDSENRLSIAIQAAELGTFDWNLKTSHVDYSERYLEIMGFDKTAVPSYDDLIKRVHPDDLKFRNEAIEAALQTGALDIELRMIPDGKNIRWVNSRGKVFYDEQQVPERMLGTMMDITEQKMAFEVLKNFNEKLQKSELLFKTIANASPVGLWMTDKNAQNTFVNDTWIRWTGIPLEQQFGRGWLDRVIEEDKITAPAKFQECMEQRKKYSAEFRILRKDGELRWCLTEGSPYYDTNGDYAGYAGSVTDITERKMVEEELEKKVKKRTHELNLANSALEKSNDELEQFAYVASHDLQEPLRKIKTFVSRLQEINEEKPASQGTVYMDKIISASGRMSDLIRDLLEYSRIAKMTEQHIKTDLSSVLDNVLEDFELLINQKNALIQAVSLPVIRGIPHQMNQLFSNLINNSLKFSMEDRPPVITITSKNLSKEETIRHNLSPDQLYNEIIFEDNGIGFSNEFSEKIFEVFQRLNARSSYAGSGIGLSICRKIVMNHQGLIFADSIEGKGTRFHIILPLENENVRLEAKNRQKANQ